MALSGEDDQADRVVIGAHRRRELKLLYRTGSLADTPLPVMLRLRSKILCELCSDSYRIRPHDVIFRNGRAYAGANHDIGYDSPKAQFLEDKTVEVGGAFRRSNGRNKGEMDRDHP